MNTSTFCRLRDEYALADYYTQIPQLHHQRVQLRRKIVAVNRALAYERARLNRLKEKAHNRTEIGHLEDRQRTLYALLAPVNSAIANIERDIPVRRARLESMV